MSPLSRLQAEHMTQDTKPSTLCGGTKNSASAINVIMVRNQGLHNIPYILALETWVFFGSSTLSLVLCIA